MSTDDATRHRYYSVIYADGTIGCLTAPAASFRTHGIEYSAACGEKYGSRVVAYVPLSFVPSAAKEQLT